MHLVQAVALTLSCICSFQAHYSEGKPKHQLYHETPDVGKVFASFPHVLSIADVDKDGDLDCLAAVRTDYDKSIPRATFVWIFPGLNGREPINISYVGVQGESPDEVRFWDQNGDGTAETARYVYTDYKECLIADLYERKECMLWTSWEVKDHISQECWDQFEDNCEDAHMSYDEDTCRPFINF
uniref:Putative lipocalin-5 1 n=1 Tax=Amblyomma triste TaxID=251400 RepID=A0A023G975_AMBTT